MQTWKRSWPCKDSNGHEFVATVTKDAIRGRRYWALGDIMTLSLDALKVRVACRREARNA